MSEECEQLRHDTTPDKFYCPLLNGDREKAALIREVLEAVYTVGNFLRLVRQVLIYVGAPAAAMGAVIGLLVLMGKLG